MDTVIVNNATLWFFLSMFLLILLLIVTAFYAYALGTRINPAECFENSIRLEQIQ